MKQKRPRRQFKGRKKKKKWKLDAQVKRKKSSFFHMVGQLFHVWPLKKESPTPSTTPPISPWTFAQKSMCEPGAVGWIEDVFDDCIVTVKDKWSFGIGLVSSVAFLVSSLPQIVLNFREKRVDGQSPFFFGLLFFGSVLNLIGVFITKGIITQKLQGVLYCILDGILFGQFIVYKYILKTNGSHAKFGESESESFENEESGDDNGKFDGMPPNAITTAVLVGEVASTNWSAPYTGDQLAGTLFGWIATVIYISSRIPQITKNAQLHSVGDLSPFYFFLSITGNLTYCISVFLRSIEGDYLWKQTPFIAGAMGPLICDFIVLLQMAIYGKPRSISENDEKTQQMESSNEVNNINEL